MPTHIPMQYSRRAVLSGAATTSIFATAISAVATQRAVAGSVDLDAELFRRIATAKRRWADFVATRETSEHLYRVTCHHTGCSSTIALSVVNRVRFNKLADETGYREAANNCEQTHELYGEAMDKAFATPACTVQGLSVKMKFAAERAQVGDMAAYLGSEFEWLDIAMADLERLAG